MSRLAVRLGAVVIATVAVLVGVPGTASAHPLGNFTVNRYSGVVVSSEAISVDHVVDLAEVPTAQRTPAIDTDGDGSLSRPELSTWARTQCRDAARSLRLTVDGRRADLSVSTSGARTAPGQAGLATLRLECGLRAPAAIAAATAVRLVDGAGEGEVGWREMTARGDGTTLSRSDAPQRSRSARLTAYPQDLLTDPLDVRSVRLAARPGGPRLGADDSAEAPAQTLTRGADRLTLAFEGLLTRTEGRPWLGLVAVLAALGLGAAHAVAPGHGKTVMAFYLSGRREGALRAAATVGATVTATHTAGVLALGLLVSAGTAFVPARVYPWLSLVSGLLVVLVGLALLREAAARRTRVHQDGTHSHGLLGTPHSHTHTQTRTLDASHPSRVDHATSGILIGATRAAAGTHPATAVDHAALGILVRDAEPDNDHQHPHPHPHPHDDEHPHPHQHPHDHPHPHPHQHPHDDEHPHPHPHPHDHPHPHEHPHPQDPAEAGAPSRRGLIAIGLAGGLLPSPSALLVLLGAVAVGHAWFGVALVVAFGLGMAATLAVVGLLVMRLRERAELRLRSHPASRLAPMLRIAPAATAVVVVVLGAALAWRGLGATGLL